MAKQEESSEEEEEDEELTPEERGRHKLFPLFCFCPINSFRFSVNIFGKKYYQKNVLILKREIEQIC